MAIKRALQHLGIQLTVAAAIVAVVALIVFGAEGTSIAHAFVTAPIAVGALALLLGALGIGGGSPVQTLINTYGRFLTVDELETAPPGQAVVNGTVVLLLTGALLIGAGILVDVGRGGRGPTVAGRADYKSYVEIWSPDNSFIALGDVDPRGFSVADVEPYIGYSTEDPSESGRGCAYRFHDTTDYAEIDIATDPLGDPLGPPFPGDSGRFLDSPPSLEDLAYNAVVLRDGRLKPLGHRRELRV